MAKDSGWQARVCLEHGLVYMIMSDSRNAGRLEHQSLASQTPDLEAVSSSSRSCDGDGFTGGRGPAVFGLLVAPSGDRATCVVRPGCAVVRYAACVSVPIRAVLRSAIARRGGAALNRTHQ